MLVREFERVTNLTNPLPGLALRLAALWRGVSVRPVRGRFAGLRELPRGTYVGVRGRIRARDCVTATLSDATGVYARVDCVCRVRRWPAVKRGTAREPLEKTLRRVLREELPRYGR